MTLEKTLWELYLVATTSSEQGAIILTKLSYKHVVVLP